MTITFTLPLLDDKPKTTRDMAFTILTSKYPLSLTELYNSIKKEYAYSVSFQAVRKSILQLVDEKVLVKEEKKFSINREWILEVIKFGNNLQKEYFSKKKDSESKIEVGPNIAVYNVHNLIEMDNIWNNVMKDYFSSEKTNNIIAFEATHFWWVIAQLAQETDLMKGLSKHGIQSHFICYGNTPLDRWTADFYNDIEVKCIQKKRPKGFAIGHNIGVYGDLVIQATHPKDIAEKIENFFTKYKNIGQAKPNELMTIAMQEIDIRMTVIKDPLLAEKVREDMLKNFRT